MHVCDFICCHFKKKIVAYTMVWIQFFLIPSWNQLQGQGNLEDQVHPQSDSYLNFSVIFFIPLIVFVVIVCFWVGEGLSGTYLYLGLFSIFFIFTLFWALVSTFSMLPPYHFKEMEAFLFIHHQTSIIYSYFP